MADLLQTIGLKVIADAKQAVSEFKNLDAAQQRLVKNSGDATKSWSNALDKVSMGLAKFNLALGGIEMGMQLVKTAVGAVTKAFDTMTEAQKRAGAEQAKLMSTVFGPDMKRLTESASMTRGMLLDIKGVAEELSKAGFGDATALLKELSQAASTGDVQALRQFGIVIEDTGRKSITTAEALALLKQRQDELAGRRTTGQKVARWTGGLQAFTKEAGQKGAFAALGEGSGPIDYLMIINQAIYEQAQAADVAAKSIQEYNEAIRNLQTGFRGLFGELGLHEKGGGFSFAGAVGKASAGAAAAGWSKMNDDQIVGLGQEVIKRGMTMPPAFWTRYSAAIKAKQAGLAGPSATSGAGGGGGGYELQNYEASELYLVDKALPYGGRVGAGDYGLGADPFASAKAPWESLRGGSAESAEAQLAKQLNIYKEASGFASQWNDAFSAQNKAIVDGTMSALDSIGALAMGEAKWLRFRAGIQAAWETAEAIGAAAIGDWRGATLHGLAAVKYGLVAGMSGGAPSGMGGGGGGAGGGYAPSSNRSGGESSTINVYVGEGAYVQDPHGLASMISRKVGEAKAAGRVSESTVVTRE